MKAFTGYLQEYGEFAQAAEALLDGRSVAVSGCVDSQKVHSIYYLGDAFKQKVIVTFSEKRVKEICEDARFYEKEVMAFPARDYVFMQADIRGQELTRERLKAYRRILEGKTFTLVTTFDAFMAPMIGLKHFSQHRIFLQDDSVVEEQALAARLVTLGYEKTYQVEEPGQFSIRGGIIDVFDLTQENPYRIELWGDEVESLRSFDVLSQRSIEELSAITIYPATELILSESRKREGLKRIEKEAGETAAAFRKRMETEKAAAVLKQLSYLKEQIEEFGVLANLDSYIRYFYEDTQSLYELFSVKNTLFVLDEPARLKEHADAVELEFRESMMHRMEQGMSLAAQGSFLYSTDNVFAKFQTGNLAVISTLDQRTPYLTVDMRVRVEARSINSYQNSFEALCADLKRYKKQKYRVILLCPSRTRAVRLTEDLNGNECNAFYSETDERILSPGEIGVQYGHVCKGFEYPMLKLAVISETDIFGAKRAKKKRKKYFEGQKIHSFTDLNVGDYVVHESHGLGIYRGIEKIERENVVKDYMKIEYRDGGNLYVLATGFDVVQKYASSDAAKQPKLNKLGTQEWSRTKTKVRQAVEEIARDLVELYAKRQMKEGFVYGEDTVWQKEFEELFPYEETEDQMNAILSVKQDMESKKVMDRLVCGDVGYGKTEVAIRAAFKAAQEGKQVVFLVPTTILAQQHYDTFVQRMKDFPVNIGMLSRFRTAKQQKETISGLKKGLVDIVIGTHRVLSKDVEYKDLGLLIIDEEQRFGVTHKEKIKQLKENVDVLTLTATPIPRTLHMSLVGIRDMSVLEEPPNDRMPIQTYVMEYNEEMVREAIERELSRDGQVYYVFNRVHDIADVTARIQKLVPDANVAFAHGQMKEAELERIMYDFINGEIDVLVSTTIIETGLDIPNVNTMIIHDCDRMGLSTLYQLRGRVGRSNRNAYAFLMYKRDKVLKEVAEKRLQAIREFTDLGSGFKIAMRDLEIRGAGNLLGRKQHGHMEAVGYDLYCKMLDDAVKSLKGLEKVRDFNTVIELDVDAYIPPSYIVNEYQKLDIYKRIAAVETDEEYEDMQNELLDRFGEIPKPVDNLFRIALIRVRSHRLYIAEVKGHKDGIRFVMSMDAGIKVEGIPELMKRYPDTLKFTTKGKPAFFHKLYTTGMVQKDEENMLITCEKVLTDMEEVFL
ncbi:MAG: transcription-repair coupling factor [Lachnospiraceae bacterium]|nr:transcription-repair coupling factor [Lachnospiraceae bacterium]